jgi:lysophospholipid acyltransferase (LPLAT)-like uncharacterized protein
MGKLKMVGPKEWMSRMKYRWRAFRPKVVPGILYWAVRFIGSTMRLQVQGLTEIQPKTIYCGWHGRSFIFANYARGRKIWLLVSLSNDGEIQNRLFTRLGYQIIRGSTGRGGVRAAVESIRALRAGGTMVVSPDGPRGPYHEVQGGVMLMAQKSGAAIVPVGMAATPGTILKSWDKYLLPWPFGKGRILVGAPIYVPQEATEEEVEALRLELQNEMIRLEHEAERQLGMRA